MPEGVEAKDVEKAEDDGRARERMLSSEPPVRAKKTPVALVIKAKTMFEKVTKCSKR